MVRTEKVKSRDLNVGDMVWVYIWGFPTDKTPRKILKIEEPVRGYTGIWIEGFEQEIALRTNRTPIIRHI